MFIICSVLPTFLFVNLVISNLLWFIFLYLIAAYIKIYQINDSRHQKYLYIGIGIYVSLLLSCILFDYIGIYIPIFLKAATYFSAAITRTPLLLCSVFIFIGFKNLSLKHNEIINIISSATLIVYLIHDHNYIRFLLWDDIFKNASYQYSNHLLFHSITSIAIVYAICTVVGIMYNLLLEPILLKAIFICYNKTTKKLKKYIQFNKCI